MPNDARIKNPVKGLNQSRDQIILQAYLSLYI